MGHHYIPQAYLRAFQNPNAPGMIWMYDKKTREFRSVPIKTIAQESEYYDEADERDLNEHVERPANEVFRRLREGRKPVPGDREKLELYVATMLMRVPRKRRKARDRLPEVGDKVFNDISREIRDLAETKLTDPAVVAQRLAELEELRIRYTTDPPQEIIDLIQNPWPSDRVLAAISLMTWRIVSVGRSHHFITSDNPAFFFESDGLASDGSELTFPLTADLALAASWQGAHRHTFYVGAQPAIVKEINRRAATSAERFIFCPVPSKWVGPVACKPNPYLSRINWRR